MRGGRYHQRRRSIRRNAGRCGAAGRWAIGAGRSGERWPVAPGAGMETLTWIGDDGRVQRVAFWRLGQGRLRLADGRVTTATAIAAKLRKWLAVPVRRDEG
jgi:hypothetical protein